MGAGATLATRRLRGGRERACDPVLVGAHGELLLAAGGAPELQQAGPGPAGQEAAVRRVRGRRYGPLVAELAALILDLR